MAGPEFDADVAIVGYGPTGVSAANFLGHDGVRTVVLEQDETIYPRARAVTVNDWTLRAYQAVGLAEDLKADMHESGALTWKVYKDKKTVFRRRTEVTDRMLILGQRHRRTILAQYETHYNGRRPHRSRHLQPPRLDHPPADLSRKRIKRRPVLGGLINEYERAA